MRFKYAHNSTQKKDPNGPGRPPGLRPETWSTGTDPITHDKYYAFLKHKAQSRFRKEEYYLTWEDWQTLWPDDLFLQRGRTTESLCMRLIDPDSSWNMNNVEIVTRKQMVQRSRHGIYEDDKS